MRPDAPRLLFVVTEDWYFCSHRLPLAHAARERGYHVGVATRVNAHGDRIRAAGIELLPLKRLRRSSMRPWNELAAIGELLSLYRRWRPTIVHHVAMKPVLYGSIAARLVNVPARVNALAGLGFVFSSPTWLATALRPAVKLAYGAALGGRRAITIVQNPDDRDLLVRLKLARPEAIELVRGSGVDLQRFAPTPLPDKPVVMLMSRMLWDKGVGEFVAAARLLRAEGLDVRFVLVGAPDDENPAAIPLAQLEAWQDEGHVEWFGHRDDAAEVLAMASIVCLPSYREGLPKVLIEAAACGRALIASDVPGCREVVVNGETGLVVPPRNVDALASAIRTLVTRPDLRDLYGTRARALAEAQFGIDAVVDRTLTLYERSLSSCAHS